MLQPAVTGCTVPLNTRRHGKIKSNFSQALFSERSEHSGLIFCGCLSASLHNFGGSIMPHWHMIGRLVVWLFLFGSREGRLSLTEEPSVQLPFLSVQACYLLCWMARYGSAHRQEQVGVSDDILNDFKHLILSTYHTLGDE